MSYIKINKLLMLMLIVVVFVCPEVWAKVNHVVLVSFDGLRPDAISKFENRLPHFHRLITEGAYTFNARNDTDYTVTIPNHTCMLTSRRVSGPGGHGITLNKDTDLTVHQIKGENVASVFDGVRQQGLTSTMDASKLKFEIFAKSFPIDAVHLTDQNDGETMTYALRALAEAKPPSFLFVHFAGTDFTGHHEGWDITAASPYMKAVMVLDDYLAQLMRAIEALNEKGDSAVLIVTTDHGGVGKDHANPRDKRNYTIPFMVWGATIARGKDLYALNSAGRINPGSKQISWDAVKQPVRNGEAANCALHLLGLECVPKSTIGCVPALVVEDPKRAAILPVIRR